MEGSGEGRAEHGQGWGLTPEQLRALLGFVAPGIFLLNKSSGSQLEAPVGALLTPDLPSCHLQHLFVTLGEPRRDGPWCGRFAGAGHGFTMGCELS